MTFPKTATQSPSLFFTAHFDGQPVNMMSRDSSLWVMADDMALALGYDRPSSFLRIVPEDLITKIALTVKGAGVDVLGEEAVRDALTRSRKPKSLDFWTWWEDQDVGGPGSNVPEQQVSVDAGTEPTRDTKIRLDRPIVFYDLETTGLDPGSDMITEIAAYRLVPGESGPVLDEKLVTYVNPEINIPEEATEIHGISNKDVADSPTFEDLMPRLKAMMGDADLAAYNGKKFDGPFLKKMFRKHGEELPGPDDQVTVDPLLIERSMTSSNKLGDVYQRYKGEELTDAHEAGADVEATIEVLNGQLRGLPMTGDLTSQDLAGYVDTGEYVDPENKLRREGDDLILTFGRHSGKTLRTVFEQNPGYIQNFLLDTENMGPHVRKHLDL